MNLKERNKTMGRLLCRKNNDKNEIGFQHGSCFPSSQNKVKFQFTNNHIQVIQILTSSPSEVQGDTENVLLAAGIGEL